MTRHIDWDKVDQLFISGSNITQAAAALGIHKDTLYKKCELEKKTSLSLYYDEKREHGNTAIHLAQYQKAIKDKNPTMLIWLGKQRLQQKETLDDRTSKDIEKKFDEKMDQVLKLLSTDLDSDRKTEANSINSETKS